MYLIVGLGNPGKQYERTRHNVGFIILDALHRELAPSGMSNWELSKKFNAEIAGCQYAGKKILLAKPMTFMNHSGEAVDLLARYYKLTPKDLLIIHDDKDLPLGEIKLQEDRGHAGHNGVRSIMEHTGTKEFSRLRVGIAPIKKEMKDIARFVLGKFRFFERRPIQAVIQQSVEKVLDFVK